MLRYERTAHLIIVLSRLSLHYRTSGRSLVFLLHLLFRSIPSIGKLFPCIVRMSLSRENVIRNSSRSIARTMKLNEIKCIKRITRDRFVILVKNPCRGFRRFLFFFSFIFDY